MRFTLINKSHFPLLREECLDNLIYDFGVKSYGDRPAHVSELERMLVFGKARLRYDTDFSDDSSRRMGQRWWHILDHDYMFKCDSGMTFMMTMPYDTHESFHEKFDAMMSAYYERKGEIARLVDDPNYKYLRKRYGTLEWRKQFAITQKIDAVIVDDKYKIRENGDFAAVIATTETLHAMGLA